MDQQLKKNLSSSEYWFRALYVVIFLLCAEIAGTLIIFLAISQIIFTLVTGGPSQRLIGFGDSLSKYLFAIFNFVSCRSEEKPFPFADWPEADCLENTDENSSPEDVEDPQENTVDEIAAEDIATPAGDTVNTKPERKNKAKKTVEVDESTSSELAEDSSNPHVKDDAEAKA